MSPPWWHTQMSPADVTRWHSACLIMMPDVMLSWLFFGRRWMPIQKLPLCSNLSWFQRPYLALSQVRICRPLPLLGFAPILMKDIKYFSRDFPNFVYISIYQCVYIWKIFDFDNSSLCRCFLQYFWHIAKFQFLLFYFQLLLDDWSPVFQGFPIWIF